MYMEVKEKMLEVILVKLLAIRNKLTENNLLIFVSTMHSQCTSIAQTVPDLGFRISFCSTF